MLRSVFVGLSLVAFGVEASASLFGSTGKDAGCREEHSEAWCAVDALGMRGGLEDAPGNRVLEAISKQPGSGTADMIAAVASTKHLIASPVGLSGAAQGGIFLLSALADNWKSLSPLSNANFIFGWSQGTDWTRQLDEIEQAELKAALEVTGATSFEVVSAVKTQKTFGLEPHPALADRMRGPLRLVLHGGACDEGSCYVADLSAHQGYKAVTRVAAPGWTGIQGEADFLRIQPWMVVVNGKDISSMFIPALSSHLPSWAYASVGKASKASGPEGDGMVVNWGSGAVHLWKAGVPLLLAFPEVDAAMLGYGKRQVSTK